MEPLQGFRSFFKVLVKWTGIFKLIINVAAFIQQRLTATNVRAAMRVSVEASAGYATLA
jgi:hypothetical protein